MYTTRGFGSVGGGGEQEMVEKLVTGFGEVVEGRKSWKDLLRGVLDGGSTSDLGGGGGGSSSRRRR